MSEPGTELAALAHRSAAVTAARVFTGRAGTAYRTADLLRLRADHAAARDAVLAELDVSVAGLAALTGGRPATVVTSGAGTHVAHLATPPQGRRLPPEARAALAGLTRGADLQLVLGDGLSARALQEQAPAMVARLLAGARRRGWSVGDLVVVRHCRVGILNDFGEVLDPAVVVLLVGQRPGLGTPASLSAYLGYRPRPGHTDADRNLVANIHARGLDALSASERVLGLAEAVRAAGRSGVRIKEPAAPGRAVGAC